MDTPTLADTVSQKAIDIMSFVEKTATNTTDFVVTQTPLFIQELLAWNFTVSLIHFLLALCFFIYSATLLYKTVKNFEDKDGQIAAIILSGLVGVFSLMTICHDTDWLKIKIAPRVWLVDYAKEIIKK